MDNRFLRHRSEHLEELAKALKQLSELSDSMSIQVHDLDTVQEIEKPQTAKYWPCQKFNGYALFKNNKCLGAVQIDGDLYTGSTIHGGDGFHHINIEVLKTVLQNELDS
jgi:hypothetical protein